MNKDDLPFLPTAHGYAVSKYLPALFDDKSEEWLRYGALQQKVLESSQAYDPPSRGLVLCCAPRSVSGVIAYLAAVEAGQAIILADPTAPNLENIAKAYDPEWIVAPLGLFFEGYDLAPWDIPDLLLFKRQDGLAAPLHPDLFLVLLTSGSTGSSKGVRLSYANIASNTRAIIQSLELKTETNALCHLPLSYSFGMSVLHMQLAVGGQCVLTEQSMMEGDFWKRVRAKKVSLFPGVPYHYEMMMRLGLDRLNVPDLTTFLQAGGKMQRPLTEKMLQAVQNRPNGELFIMYGQTEASPRISCFPLHKQPEKIGSSGTALPGGKLEIEDGEIVYSGPNVMMGQAHSRDDLTLGDVMGGRLATGDLGELDQDGYLTITGRSQRFAKLFGQRIALDDLERIAAPIAFTVALESPEKILLYTTCSDPSLQGQILGHLVKETKLPAPWFEIKVLEEIPVKPNGKVDYQKLHAIGV